MTEQYIEKNKSTDLTRHLEMIKGSYELTEKGRTKAGGEKKHSKYGPFFVWNPPKEKPKG